MGTFNPNILTQADYLRMVAILGSRAYQQPDLTITAINPKTGEDEPYLFRWHVTPRTRTGGNCYLHVQVSSDPERPLHTHPWPNMSVIESEHGYHELIDNSPPFGPVHMERRAKGQTIIRQPHVAHRLVLPEGVPYVMTMFFTGVATGKGWGFWIGSKLYPHSECLRDLGNNRSVFTYPPGTHRAGENG